MGGTYFEEFLAKGIGIDSFYPEESYPTIGVAYGEESGIHLDSAGNLVTRGSILSDEGSLRHGFSGSSLSTPITGTLTFTNGGSQVVGNGTSFKSMGLSTFHSDFIKLDADSEFSWVAVSSIEDDTHLTLAENYTGTGGSGSASFTQFKPVTGSGGSITVSGGNCVIGSGTTSNAKTYILKIVDYCPLIFMGYASVSQRIANQTGYLGLVSDTDTFSNSAWFEFSGTSNLTVVCKSSLGSEVESTSIYLPNGYTTADSLRYRIEITPEYVSFSIEGVISATHYNKTPDPYTMLSMCSGWVNGTGTATTSTISVSTVFISNSNVLQTQNGFSGLPLRVDFAPTQRLGSFSASSLNAYILSGLEVMMYKTITVQLTGVWQGRIQFSASNDNITYYPVSAVCIDDNIFQATAVGNGIFVITNSGFSYISIRVIGYTSGTVTAEISLNAGALPIPASSPKVALYDQQNNREIMITDTREMRVVEGIRLIGKSFEGTTLDTVYWTPTVANGGTNTLQDGYISMATTTNSASSAKVQTVRVARFVAGSQNVFRSASRFQTEGITNNVRRLGVFDANNGFFFQLSGTTFSVVTRLNGVDTVKSSGFNGTIGDSYTMNTSSHSFEIAYLYTNVEFYIDGKLLHEYKFSDRPQSATLNLPAAIENLNIGAVSGASVIESRFAGTYRLGKYETAPKSQYINTATTTTLKSGAGVIQKIITGGASKSTITVYDNTAGSGTVLLSLDCSYIYAPTILLGLEFYTGLTVVTTSNVYGSVPVCTVVFE